MSNETDKSQVEHWARQHKRDMRELDASVRAIEEQMHERETRFFERALSVFAGTEWMTLPRVGDLLVESGWDSPQWRRHHRGIGPVFVVTRIGWFNPGRRWWAWDGDEDEPADEDKLARLVVGKAVTAVAITKSGIPGRKELAGWRRRDVIGHVKTSLDKDGDPVVDCTAPVVVERLDPRIVEHMPGWARGNA